MFKKICFALLASLLLAGSAMAAQRTIVAAHDATYPPMEFMNQDKEIVGFSVDLLDAIAQAADFKVVHKSVAWDGIFAGLDSGKYDVVCSSVSITDKRKKAMLFSDPYFEVTQALVVPKDSKAKTLADLKGKPVGGQIGTTGYFAIKNDGGVEPKSYDELGLAFEDLYNGRLAGIVSDAPTVADFALQNEKYKAKMKIVGTVDTGETEYYGMAAAKGNHEVIDLINKGLAKIKADGTYDAIKAKWIGN